jgi:hypothetical protein
MYLNTIQKKYLRTLDAGQAIIQHGSENPTPVDLINHETEGTVSESLLEYFQEDKWQNLSYRDSVSKKVDGADNSDPSDSDLGKYL